MSFLRSVGVAGGTAASEPFTMNLRGLRPGSTLPLDLQFMGWYGEPNLRLEHKVPDREQLPSR